MEKINAAHKQHKLEKFRKNFHEAETVMYHAPGTKNSHLI